MSERTLTHRTAPYLLEHQGEGRVVAAHALHGGLQGQEALLLDGGRDLGREAACSLGREREGERQPERE
jgi:hypothetical protein